MAGRLAGRVAVVTGASRGIGRAILEALRVEGAVVTGCSRSGGVDVRSATAVEAFAKSVLGQLGPPDILVNNAGVVARAPLADLTEADWDAVVDVNLKGTFLVTRAFLPAMKEAAQRHGRSGRIVNIASISGRLGTAGLTAYCAAKHGVVGLTRALADEVKADRIQVNAVCPGSVDTDMLRQGRPGAKPDMTPADVARVVLFLAAEAPDALTGSCIDVFG